MSFEGPSFVAEQDPRPRRRKEEAATLDRAARLGRLELPHAMALLRACEVMTETLEN